MRAQRTAAKRLKRWPCLATYSHSYSHTRRRGLASLSPESLADDWPIGNGCGEVDLKYRPLGYECHHQRNLKTMRGAKSKALFFRRAHCIMPAPVLPSFKCLGCRFRFWLGSRLPTIRSGGERPIAIVLRKRSPLKTPDCSMISSWQIRGACLSETTGRLSARIRAGKDEVTEF